VERDLHDGAQQQLVLLGMKLAMMKRLGGSDPVSALAMIDDITAELEVALRELRELAHGLYPQQLASDGLPAALSEAAQRAAIPTRVDCDGVGRVSPEVEAAVYFCCLEALQNAGKHAGAGATAFVRLGRADDALRFEVTDDGLGFTPDRRGATSGLQNMIDRIGALGGELDITSAPGSGTTISGAVPLRD
jgi:signal transduction histidine kinase